MSGLVDVEFYSTQRSRSFTTWSAAWDFLASDPGEHLTFHPLVDGEWVARHTLRAGRFWYSALFMPGPQVTSTSPVFDVIAAAQGASHSAARVLRDFVTRAQAETPLPVTLPGAVTTMGGHRSQAINRERTAADMQARAAPVSVPEWDAAAERRYRDAAMRANEPDDGSPVVTVVMPVKDRAREVVDAIRSVVAQTFTAWELIVVDDGSSDGTSEAVRALLDDPRIRLFETESRGVSGARNMAIAHARAPYLAFLDSDNQWDPDFLAILLGRALAAPRSTVVYSAAKIREDASIRYLGRPTDYRSMRDGGNVIDLNAMVARRTDVIEVGAFDEDLERWVDYDLQLRLLRAGTAEYCPFLGVLYDHRASRGDRITTTRSIAWRDVVLGRHLEHADRATSPGSMSVVVTAEGMTWSSVLATVARVPEQVEVIVAAGQVTRSFLRIVGQVAELRGMRLVATARRESRTLLTARGIALATGEYLVLVVAGVEPTAELLEIFAAELLDRSTAVVDSAVVARDGSCAVVGGTLDGADALPEPIRVAVVGVEPETAKTAAGLLTAFRTVDVRAAGGIDLRLTGMAAVAELCRRVSPGGVKVLTRHPAAADFSEVIPVDPVDPAEAALIRRVLSEVTNGRA